MVTGQTGGGSTLDAVMTRQTDCSYMMTGGGASNATLLYNQGLSQWDCSIEGTVGSDNYNTSGILANGDPCVCVGNYTIQEPPGPGVFIFLTVTLP